MDVLTAWVKSPPQVGGLDHLAVQAPCINIYGRLLPGITNVTDRARYYSFYSWLIWALDQEKYGQYNDSFIDCFRKADCLFTLIAERHAQVSDDERDDHAAALIGSRNLGKAVGKIRDGEAIHLSDYAHREDKGGRYFKNTLGGLGQYYLGPFSELEILDGTTRAGVKYTKQKGELLARAMDRAMDRSLFMKTIEEDVVAPERLEQLSTFCPCCLKQRTEEQTLLKKLFFVQKDFYHEDTLARRRSLQLLMYLADALAEEEKALNLNLFRACVYTGALPGGAPWNFPEGLGQNRANWAVYQRNELLSIAMQGIFFVLLDAYQSSGLSHSSSVELCAWFVEQPEVQGLSKDFDLHSTFEQLVNESHDWLPALHHWFHEANHEIRLAESIVDRCDRHQKEDTLENRREILRAALKILIALHVREETRNGYGKMGFSGNYLLDYPINLSSFLRYTQDDWSSLPLKEWIGWLCSYWGINTHLRVALRKSQSCF